MLGLYTKYSSYQLSADNIFCAETTVLIHYIIGAMPPPISGIILAGGKSRRMGGGDKALLSLAGKPLIAHAAARLRPQVSRVIINANHQPERYREFADTVVPDIISGYAGPLAGIHAGMCAAADEWLLSVPCDSPFFPLQLAGILQQAAITANADIAVATSGGRAQPVFMLAHCRLADTLAAHIIAGNRKIDHWYQQHTHTCVEFTDTAAFANINTPDELTLAEQQMERAG